MDPFPRWFFYREVERQCQFARMAYDALEEALNEYQQPRPASPEPNSEDAAQIRLSTARLEQWDLTTKTYEQKRKAASDRLWYAVQAFLVAAGNISTLLWPSYRKGEGRTPERGPELRAGLAVEEDSPLAPRTLRNHFEHFDERLEEWAVSPGPRKVVDSNIGPVSAISGYDPKSLLRHFDPATFTVIFRGETYDLPPVIEAIEAIHQRATEKLRERAWGVSDRTQGSVRSGTSSGARA
jgi:hypothetical protein